MPQAGAFIGTFLQFGRQAFFQKGANFKAKSLVRRRQCKVHLSRPVVVVPSRELSDIAAEAIQGVRIISAAFSAIATVEAKVFADGSIGIIDASTTRSPVTLCTRSVSSTTAVASVSGPMRQVPTKW